MADPIPSESVANVGSPEIEVTAEMIEAGLLSLFDYDPRFGNERDTVATIFRVMSGQKASVLMLHLPVGFSEEVVSEQKLRAAQHAFLADSMNSNQRELIDACLSWLIRLALTPSHERPSFLLRRARLD